MLIVGNHRLLTDYAMKRKANMKSNFDRFLDNCDADMAARWSYAAS